MTDIAPRYNPCEIEELWYKHWEKSGYFSAPESESEKVYSIVIPPPNITGELHMGHALNNTIQDIAIRYKRMSGFDTLWLPGTDHASIATENVVERQLKREKITKRELGREKFIERVWQWKEKYGSAIIHQLKSLGCSCDWKRIRFTMDEGLSRAVREVFVYLYNKGLIYRGNYLVNWCPRCRTALSDDEAEHVETDGKLWWLKYPVEGTDKFVEVATTRPETMLGDTAVAVNPKDERHNWLKGKTVMLPLLNRPLRVIQDEFVSMDFGSGAVKVTPAHDPNDFEMGKKHNLEFINILTPDGMINENAGPYAGLERFECRKKVIEDLQSQGLLKKIDDYKISIRHCYRCSTVIEPYISKQWFVKMQQLATPAAEAARNGRVKFFPEKWTSVYLHWLDNVRDWCISRQLWWGHRIPVYYCEKCGKEIASIDELKECPDCKSAVKQDEDVLDTWFSSALWPFSTMGWPDKNPLLEKYFPTDLLVTDRGIIYFWVARMVLMALEFTDNIPFHYVYIHGTILDELGRKMSKSLGNGIDPLEMSRIYGTDAVRFSLIMLTVEGQDVKLSPARFEMGRNFANKLWNAARFTLMNLKDIDYKLNKDNVKEFCRELEDRWIISKLANTVIGVNQLLEKYAFNEAASLLYHFIWHDFCDWYLELSKPRIQTGGDSKSTAQNILFFVLDNILRLLHPFMPFVTEELWSKLYEVIEKQRGKKPSPALCASALIYPQPDVFSHLCDSQSESQMDNLQGMAERIRDIRARYTIPAKTPLKAVISSTAQTYDFFKANENFIMRMANVEKVSGGVIREKPKQSAMAILNCINFSEQCSTKELVEIYVPLGEIMDIEAEKQRLSEELKKTEGFIENTDKRLANSEFINKAPQEVIEKTKNTLEQLCEKSSKLKETLKQLE
ncbi:MAG: valine--tRNA ligase [Planctomycetota bacterium]